MFKRFLIVLSIPALLFSGYQEGSSLNVTTHNADNYEYLIITFPDVIDAWTPFVEFNTRRGMRTKIIDITDIAQNGDGEDLAAKVRNCIKEEYEQHKIIFVALGGDVTQDANSIPARLLWSEFYDHNQTSDRYNTVSTAADMYFGTLDGNWNTDGDSLYGEPGEEDMFSEVFVSRFPCDNETDLTNLIHKIIKYSEEPVRDEVLNYLGLGHFLWASSKSIWGAMYIDLYIGLKDSNDFITYGIPDNFSIERLDDRTGGGEGSWDDKDLTTIFNDHKPAWIDHEGHGNPDIAFGVYPNVIDTVFNNDGIQSNYFIGITSGSESGQFHKRDNCIVEILENHQHAAVAGIAASGFVYHDDDGDDSPYGRVIRYLHDALFNPDKRVHLLGAMQAISKEANVDLALDSNALNTPPYFGTIRYHCYTTNLFGDAAMSVWTDAPKDLVQPFEYTANADRFTMKTPPYTQVALADASTGEIFSSRLTGYDAGADNSFNLEDSLCSISDDAYKDYVASNDKVKVYIKAHNYIANSFELNISTSIINTADFSIKQYSIKHGKGKVLITFTVHTNEFVNLSIYNSKGTMLKTVLNHTVQAGDQFVTFEKRGLSNGIYYCRIKTKNSQNIKPFLITR